jgi:hypothetical protein
MEKFAINCGIIDLNSESKFNDVLEKIWGQGLTESESEDGEVDSYIKFGHTVGAWIDGAGCGWIEVPQWLHGQGWIHVPD